MSAGTRGAVGRAVSVAVRQEPAPRWSARRGVGALTAATACAYAAYGLIRFRRFRDGTFDLVIFDQAVRAYAHFRAPASMARGVADGIGTHFLVLGDHWSPILALLAPLYWVHDGPTTLIIAQAAAFALAIPPLWVFTRRLLGTGAAYFVAGAYALSLPVAAAIAFDFHEVAFVPALTAVMAERFQAGRRAHAVIAAVALLMVKEDMGLLVAGYGAYLFLVKERRLGLSFIVGGVAATWLSTRVLIPAFGGSAGFYWAYGQLGSTVPAAAWHVVAHPLQTLRLLVTPAVKVSTMLSLVVPLGLAPLASPMVVAVVPLLLERMLAEGYPSWWTATYHYDAFIVMLLLLAAVDGAARLQRLSGLQVRSARPWLRIGPRARRAGEAADRGRGSQPAQRTMANLDDAVGEQGGAAGEQGHAVAEQGGAAGEQGHAVAKQGHAVTEQGDAAGKRGDALGEQGHDVREQRDAVGEHGDAVGKRGDATGEQGGATGPRAEALAVDAAPEAARAGAAPAEATAARNASAPTAPLAGERRGRWIPLASVWAVGVCVAAVVALPQSPLGQLLHPKFYTVNARITAAAAAASLVPDGALVEAADYVGPHLSDRAQVLLLDGTPRWAPWVVADTRGLDFPFCSPGQQSALVGYLKANGYTQVFSRDGYVVLHRAEDGRTRAALSKPARAGGMRGNSCAPP